MFIGHPFSDSDVCRLAYEVEKRHHGTPSGIDNTVITYSIPVYFEREKGMEALAVGAPISLVIANSGIHSPTSEVVGAVRKAWEQDPVMYNDLFDQAGSFTNQARTAILQGRIAEIGPLMTENHACLQKMGVSAPVLDHLVHIALQAGASGAKLSGAGRGGNIIALVTPETLHLVAQALQSAGAANIITTTVSASLAGKV
jgi:mevalonate kinase